MEADFHFVGLFAVGVCTNISSLGYKICSSGRFFKVNILAAMVYVQHSHKAPPVVKINMAPYKVVTKEHFFVK